MLRKNAKIKILIAVAIILAVTIFAVAGFFSDVSNYKKYKNMGGDNSALFLAIAKAESGFNPNALSQKGAVGLCQIMPKTAKWCADELFITFDENMLYNAEYNAKIAVFYLEYLQDKFQTQQSVICAYNAGEGNVTKWLKDAQITKNGTLKNIPFQETKEYLKKVEKYKWKFDVYEKLGI